jgi:hypothetical protein
MNENNVSNRALLGAIFILLFIVFALLYSLVANSSYVPAF